MKNRVHLDINAATGIADADDRMRAIKSEVARLTDAGASVLHEIRIAGGGS